MYDHDPLEKPSHSLPRVGHQQTVGSSNRHKKNRNCHHHPFELSSPILLFVLRTRQLNRNNRSMFGGYDFIHHHHPNWMTYTRNSKACELRNPTTMMIMLMRMRVMTKVLRIQGWVVCWMKLKRISSTCTFWTTMPPALHQGYNVKEFSIPLVLIHCILISLHLGRPNNKLVTRDFHGQTKEESGAFILYELADKRFYRLFNTQPN